MTNDMSFKQKIDHELNTKYPGGKILLSDNSEFDFRRKTVFKDRKVIKLTPYERDIIAILSLKETQYVKTDDIICYVWDIPKDIINNSYNRRLITYKNTLSNKGIKIKLFTDNNGVNEYILDLTSCRTDNENSLNCINDSDNLLEQLKPLQTKYPNSIDSVIPLPENRVKIIFVNGDIYEGSISNGDINGYGIMTYSENNDEYVRYKGEWINGRHHKGTLECKDGNIYNGEFTADEKKKSVICTPVSAPSRPNTDFIGRKEEISEINRILNDRKIIAVSGMGGIGKTAVCRKMFWTLYESPVNTHAFAWVNYRESLYNSLKYSFENENISDEQEYLKYIKSYINTFEGKVYLFIDNADDMTAEELSWLSSCNCYVAISSRKKFENIYSYTIKSLSIETCLELYNNLSNNTNNEKTVLKILKKADYHTQTIELLAKTQKASDYKAEEMLECLERTGFSLEGITERIETGNSDGNKVLIEHLCTVFDICTVTDEEQLRVLKLLSLLAPNQPVRKRILKKWLNTENNEPVNMLSKLGWIEESEENTVFIHPVTAEIIRYRTKPVYSDAERMMKNLIEETETTTEYRQKMSAIYHCSSVADVLYNTGNIEFSHFLNKTGSMCYLMSLYSSALRFYERALEIREEQLGSDHPDTAIILNNIGNVCHDTGKYDDALKMHKRALSIREEKLGRDNKYTSGSYNNIGITYTSQKDYESALKYYHKAMDIKEKLYGTEHPETAMVYNNIGYVYRMQNDYDTAMDYYNKALAAYNKKSDEDNQFSIVLNINRADIYRLQGCNVKALDSYSSILKKQLNTAGECHVQTAVIYTGIAETYLNLKKYDKAKEFFSLALGIYTKLPGTTHEAKSIHSRICELKRCFS